MGLMSDFQKATSDFMSAVASLIAPSEPKSGAYDAVNYRGALPTGTMAFKEDRTPQMLWQTESGGHVGMDAAGIVRAQNDVNRQMARAASPADPRHDINGALDEMWIMMNQDLTRLALAHAGFAKEAADLPPYAARLVHDTMQENLKSLSPSGIPVGYAPNDFNRVDGIPVVVPGKGAPYVLARESTDGPVRAFTESELAKKYVDLEKTLSGESAAKDGQLFRNNQYALSDIGTALACFTRQRVDPEQGISQDAAAGLYRQKFGADAVLPGSAAPPLQKNAPGTAIPG